MIHAQSSASYRAPRASRVVDVVGAGAGLCVLLPVFAIIAVAIKISDRGPIFYRAVRVGRYGEDFRLYKFRTMRVNADRQGPAITTNSDPRVTRIGRWLRRTKIDELPQLINVLRGDMSLVGPRPEDPRYVELYSAEQLHVLDVRPGITSAASLQFCHEEQLLTGTEWERTYCEYVMPIKLQMDLDYLRHRTVWSDVYLIARTISAIGR